MKFFLPCLYLFISNLVFSQKQATNWFFGSKAGLYFNQSSPTPLMGSEMNTQDGCAVISDKDTGDLLFYTNGRNVWNRNHQLMPHGQDFPADCWSSITQSALIVPFPGDDTKFYLFSIYYTMEIGGNIFIENNCNYGRYANPLYRDIRYSIIDMSLDGGLGDIIGHSKHILLQTNTTEKLIAVPHSNGSDYWIITHEFGSNAFYSHLLTSSGFSKLIVTYIGSSHELKPDQFFSDQEAKGYMKASPDGRKIACAVSSESRPFDLFDFNATNGTLTGYVNLGPLEGQYGVSFSPDNSKLYVTTDGRPQPNLYPYPDIIVQYDLLAGDAGAVISSRKSIIRDNPFTNIPGHGIFEGFLLLETGLQLGIDGRLYATSDYAYDPSDGGIMVIIEKPNEPGIRCQVNYQKYDFGGGSVGTGLPNFIQSYFDGIESSVTCSEASSLSLFPNPTTGILNVRFRTGCSPVLRVDVVNTLGQHIASFENLGEETNIDISKVQNGVYLVILTTAYKTKLIRKIVKI